MSGKKITWDRYCLRIDEHPTLIMGGEFHYWRVPDPERWRTILEQYRAAGLNTVRIYFHWGFHNPRPGVFVFTGNRDVGKLLRICEELGLYVLVAAGPYICAETTGGGFPFWLIQQTRIRLRHLAGNLRVKYDPAFMSACRQWFEAIIAELRTHQLTENPGGCIIGFQIENEYLERIALVKGSARYMNELVEMAGELGITVPTFHNDPWDAGSWNGVTDLYSFDSYPIKMLSPSRKLPIPPWNPGDLQKRTDHLEERIAGFGGKARQGPLFIAELQGGWYNQWGAPYGFDQLYDWFGSGYQRTLTETMASQRATMMCLYMFYGGHNWGALPDPEVYTSYDYSACIREFGFPSDRLRSLRRFLLLAGSLEQSLARTDPMVDSGITSDTRGITIKSRRSWDRTGFHFIRNLSSREDEPGIRYRGLLGHQSLGGLRIPRGGSVVVLEDLNLGGVSAPLCSLETLVVGRYLDGTLLLAADNNGELLIDARLDRSQDLLISPVGRFLRIRGTGAARLLGPQDQVIYLLVISEQDANTLTRSSTAGALKLAWGCHFAHFSDSGILKAQAWQPREDLNLLLESPPQRPGFEPVDSPIPGVFHTTISGPSPERPPALKWYELPEPTIPPTWKDLPPGSWNPLEHGYLGGCILYRCRFQAKPGKTWLKLSVRHKCGVWLNGRLLGGHHTYNPGMFRPGAMNGPDLRPGDTHTYRLNEHLLQDRENELLILVESLGLSKGVSFVADTRNPRGILSADLLPMPRTCSWSIAGRDVTTLPDPYNTCGLPEEDEMLARSRDSLTALDRGLRVPESGVVWFSGLFEWKCPRDQHRPLRLELGGEHNVYIFLNGHAVGRYWGGMGPQSSFHLPEGLLLKGWNRITLACWSLKPGSLAAELKYYRIDPSSGNLVRQGGQTFWTRTHSLNIAPGKSS